MFRLSDSKMNLEFPSGQPLVSSPVQAGKLKVFGTRPIWVVSYIAYTKFHLPRPVFHWPSHIFTGTGERASASFPAWKYIPYFSHMGTTILIHDQPWIWPWLKLIFNKLDITFSMCTSQTLCHVMPVISAAIDLWRHHQNINWACETWGWSCKDHLFIISYGFFVSYEN